MKLIDVIARDVYGLMEISLSDLKKIKLALEGIELVRTGDTDKDDANEYVVNRLYPAVKDTIEKLEHLKRGPDA
jgi:hypothetical protein